jgi:cyclophilin family peptidyl-prolyl cis-trans isomerase
MRSFVLLVLWLALPVLPGVVRAQDPLIARFSTTMGDFDVLLNAQAAPITVSNFVRYAAAGIYDGTFIHRSTTANPFDIQIIQGGSYFLQGEPPLAYGVPLFPPIPLEANLPNLRGTIAMARMTAPDTATSGWFLNLQDDGRLDPVGPGTGYAVFGRVLGQGVQNVVDSLGGVMTYNFGGVFSQLPLLFPVIETQNFLTILRVEVLPFRITAARREPGGFRVDWPALSTNTPVQVERRASLSSGAWTVVSSNNTNATFFDTNAPSSGAFYRVVVP